MSENSMFDSFLEVETTEVLSTQYLNLPEGEYPAMIESLAARSVETAKGTYHFLEPQFNIDGSALCPNGQTIKDFMGRDSVKVRGSVILDLNESGVLASGPGKNVPLGQLRAAVGQNVPGLAWKPANLVGQALKVKTGLRADKNDPEKFYAEVKSFSKL